MKKIIPVKVEDIFSRIREPFQSDGSNQIKKYIGENPLVSELYSASQMQQYAKRTAAVHKLKTEKGPDKLLPRLDENEKLLSGVCDLLIEAVKEKRPVSPASEWLLDNFYIIEEQIEIGKRHFPKGYSKNLPRLANEEYDDLPRVYVIALEIIAHSDGRLDMTNLKAFIDSYQTVTQLSLGELWAIPIMLRLALIENLRRVAAQIALDRIDKNTANHWAERLIEINKKKPQNIILEIAEMVRSNPPLSPSFVAEFTRLLQGKGTQYAMALSWMEQRLSETGHTSVDLIYAENQKQASSQVTIRNSVESLRLLRTTDWREFVEEISYVEKVLQQDPFEAYPKMDFATRDIYRHVIESIAHKSPLSETEVAKVALRLAQKEYAGEDAFKKKHIGYFLIDKGLAEMQKNAQMHCTFKDKILSSLYQHKFFGYAFLIIFGTLLICDAACGFAYQHHVNIWLLIAIALVGFIGGSQLIFSIVNWVITICIKPRMLPKMDFSKSLPQDFKTLIAVPCMLSDMASVENLAEGLEVKYLANPLENLYFSLISDFPDASKENMPDDETLLSAAVSLINELNKKYKKGEHDIFYLFHRSRKWNPKENVWMGYERKRGKLGELNAFLRGKNKQAFTKTAGDTSALQNVKYVITLDTDTQLPREAAAKMVSAMAHPLNRPVYSKKLHRVVEGYGILQPRVAVTLPKENSSYFNRMHTIDSGLDPYTRVTSDVYQDLLAEGSFIGKGIYDIDMFEKVLSDRFPDNRILSHDLLEGNYIRSGLLTDVQLYEDYPSDYLSDIKRIHRWIRGDWQIASWALPFAPNGKNKISRNRLSPLSRWKILDNIRRSLVPVAWLAVLILGWTLLPYPLLWTLSVLSILFIPVLITTLWQLLHKPEDLNLLAHVRETFYAAAFQALQVIFYIICLPFEAYYNSDAIIRTNWRMIISKKHLLQWTPSSSIVLQKKTLGYKYFFMMAAPLIAIATFIVIVYLNAGSLKIAFPFLFLWFLAPLVAWVLAQPKKKRLWEITQTEIAFLQTTARKTWLFFEKFVSAQENWLPPDNFQENPVGKIAHRTSPTNIGLSLLANLSAYDFGYISLRNMLYRIELTMETMAKMERYNRHFYNWYDTITLQPLQPRYISSVDSGNLAGNLITLREGLLQLPFQRIVSERLFIGLRDTLRLTQKEFGKSSHQVFKEARELLNELCEKFPPAIQEIYNYLSTLQTHINNIRKQNSVEENSDDFICFFKLREEVIEHIDLLKFLMPWITSDIHESLKQHFFFKANLSLDSLLRIDDIIVPDINKLISQANDINEKNSLLNFKDLLENGKENAQLLSASINKSAQQCTSFADMDYWFLYDNSKHLLHIGYNVETHLPDNNHYDLLASEMRLGIYTAISQNKLPQESWFALGRLLTNAGKSPTLLSWSGSMFEYLMPQLVMPSYENTLLDETNKAMVRRQIEYGRQRNIPWGISESGYNAVDANLNYQYRAFGVPGLGLKRGLGDDLVIAPYATMLALMIMPKQATDNLQTMAQKGFEGKYGFYEAIDYTPSRQPRGKNESIVQSYMSHHQGMGFLSLAYLILNKKMQVRFESDPQFQSSLLLLQERIPKTSVFYTQTSDITQSNVESSEPQMRILKTANTLHPEIQLLSNRQYHIAISNAGAGYSRWKNLAVSRWREDATLDNWGMFCYIKDVDNNILWSNTYQPTLVEPKEYEAIFSQDRAEFRRKDNNIETHTEIIVSPEDDVEIRRIKISNRSNSKKTIQLTSYAEVVIAPHAADESHPAFSNLFVQTEILEQSNTILCSRRARSKDDTPPWMFHHFSVSDVKKENTSFETDKAKFIGRGNTISNPLALQSSKPLSGSQGPVLDPIVAIQHTIAIRPNQTAILDMVSGMAESRDVCESLLVKYQDYGLKSRAFELSWTHSHILLRQIDASEAEAQLFNRIASSIIYPNANMRASSDIIRSNYKGQSGLWAYSISGDLPIILLRVHGSENLDFVRQVIKAHSYWRLKGLPVDLVIWNEDSGSYRYNLNEQIQSFIATSGISVTNNDQYSGNIFIRPIEQITNEDRILFQTVARVILDDTSGSLSEQVNKKPALKIISSAFEPVLSKLSPLPAETLQLPEGLVFYNNYGGFSKDGKEYIMRINDKIKTPAPWVNVIANSNFGSVISESGSAYTWGVNAHEFRLTPWKNDAVSDSSGEAFYIRDEESGNYWSPMPLPKKGKFNYIVHHGFGYSIFKYLEEEIYSELTVFTDLKKDVKYCVIKLKNQSSRKRKISATGYVEWVLGELSAKSAMYIITENDLENDAIFARNRYNSIFCDKVAFFDVDGFNKSSTADRKAFIGRNNTLANPAALLHEKLSNTFGASNDPCAAIQVVIELFEEEEKEIVFRLGMGDNEESAKKLCKEIKGTEYALDALQEVKDFWNKTLSAVQIQSPDPALDILANGWIVYQALACRVWARSGYYQSGGAFGFRDQLQDVLSLLHTTPHIAREQILLAASRQFKEGDVQHWWHPPTGRGVRTMCSDDYLWLPFVVEKYIEVTGDENILQQPVSYIDGRLLNLHEESYYDLPIFSNQWETLYKHCVDAIRHGLRFGEHGLPLMGSGDWNDGMDKVGIEGKGESVWLGFFLYKVLIQFAVLAEKANDRSFADECKQQAETLKQNINKNAWDGNWYRRAYFDNGTPLGSSQNEECRIDSISQSWSVLSEAGEEEKQKQALESLNKYLVKDDAGIILLLDPPFDKSDLNPGYIKGYLPGVRENGGQYTHAAIWAMMSFAKEKHNDRVWQMFSMINPIHHGRSQKSIETYKVEPYVMAADIYGVVPHTGRGGWTWYTGSAGWMYQFITESLLGITRGGNKLSFNSCVPTEWKEYKIKYRYGNTLYEIIIKPDSNKNDYSYKINNIPQEDKFITLIDDGNTKNVEVS
ncbi:MAG: glucoamylase family protein [Arachidicoccus sp.]|nr:glucoamylase family protein [Arachidicoccus sp.]